VTFGEYRPFEGRRENNSGKHATSENHSYMLLHVWIIFQAYFKHFWNLIKHFFYFLITLKKLNMVKVKVKNGQE
jgi:hypothetical protein